MSDELHFLPLLTVTNGPQRGASFRLRPGRHRIGREDGVDVLIDDPKVSRLHATVELTGGRASITDAGSTNGTWLNDRRVAELVELRDGDRVRLGHVELRFFDPGAAPTEPVNRFGYRLSALPVGAPAVPAVALPVAVSTLPAGADLPTVTGAVALAAPTQLMGTPRRPRRTLVMISGCVVLAGWLAWAFLALG